MQTILQVLHYSLLKNLFNIKINNIQQTIQRIMSSTKPQLPKTMQLNFQNLPLSKKNFMLLLQNKKAKLTKNYIQQLKNSNPKAQKIIKQALLEIFCYKKVKSGTGYLYGLVFYKNLLVSGQLDYYEDSQFFPNQIHEAVAMICQYNNKEKNVKKKGVDYFSYAVKLQKSETEEINENLQSIGTSVVILAMQILKSMAEWYPIDYFTQQSSHFAESYKQLLSKGIIFPQKQEYVYIKEQDKKQFEANYKNFIKIQEEGELNQQQNNKQSERSNQQEKSTKKVQLDKQQKIIQKPIQTKKGSESSQVPKIMSTMNSKNANQNANLTNKQVQKNPNYSMAINSVDIKISHNNKPQEPVVSKSKPKQQGYQSKKQTSELLASIKQKQKQKQKKNMNDKNNELSSLVNQREKEKQQNKKMKQTKQSPNKVQLRQNNDGQKQKLGKSKGNQSIGHVQSKMSDRSIGKQTLIENKSTQKKPVVENNELQRQSMKKSKLPIFNQKQPAVLQRKVDQNVNKEALKQAKVNQQSHPHKRNKIFEAKGQFIPNLNQTGNPTLNQQRQRVRLNKISKVSRTNNLFKTQNTNEPNQPNQLNNINQSPTKVNKILDSNLSFSPHLNPHGKDNLSQNKYANISQQKLNQKQNKIIFKKSVPKTQKKFIQKSLFQNSQDLSIKFGLTKNIFNTNGTTNDKSSFNSDKIPYKTLSSWRYQKQYKRQYSPQKEQKHQALVYMLNKLRFKQTVVPLIPEYFAPVTLKMNGLRKAALDISSYSESSQIFFNNRIIQARLMKHASHVYVLSLLNITKKTLNIEIVDMSKLKYGKQITLLGNNISLNRKAYCNTGCYFDIKFSFRTKDLNFKFLPFDLQIDGKFIPLQLPITLLDECKVYKEISIDQVSSYQRQKGKIIKSLPFKININQLPTFLKIYDKQITSILSYTKQYKSIQNYKKENFALAHFTLRMNLPQSDQQNILSCFICQANSNIQQKSYELCIVYNSEQEETQNFAKVMIELLTFLLFQ